MPLRFYPAFASAVVSSIGDGIRGVVLPLLAVALTDDARQVALVSLAGQLPWLVVGLASGVLADRLNRRHMLWVVDIMRLVAVSVLAGLTLGGDLSIPTLALLAFVLGCCQPFFSAAWAGLIPTLLPPSKLVRANAWIGGGVLVSGTLVGSPLGAVLYGVSPAVPLILDAWTFGVSALCILVLPARMVPTQPEQREPGALLAGLRLLWRDPLLRQVCVQSSAIDFVQVGALSILVLFAGRVLGFGPVGYALLMVAFAVGGLAGVPSAHRLAARFGARRVLGVLPLVCGLIGLGFATATTSVAVIALAASFGAAALIWDITQLSLRQSVVPRELLGRVTVAHQAVTILAGAAGAPFAGLLFHSVGPHAFFFVGALVLVLCGIVFRPSGYAARHRSSRRLRSEHFVESSR